MFFQSSSILLLWALAHLSPSHTPTSVHKYTNTLFCVSVHHGKPPPTLSNTWQMLQKSAKHKYLYITLFKAIILQTLIKTFPPPLLPTHSATSCTCVWRQSRPQKNWHMDKWPLVSGLLTGKHLGMNHKMSVTLQNFKTVCILWTITHAQNKIQSLQQRKWANKSWCWQRLRKLVLIPATQK